ncbi:MAG: C40 family peptidase [Lachnospiraceae bacterium]|nr:C40 family peptidase [Lachnospiraceae bacterium]
MLSVALHAVPVYADPTEEQTQEGETAPSEEEIRRQQEIEALKAQQQQMEQEISGARSELQSTEGRISTLHSRVSSLQGEQAALLGEMDEVNRDIFDRMSMIDVLEEDIAELQSQYEIKQEEYDEARGQEVVQYEAMKNRIRFMYEKGDVTYVEMIMKAATFGEMLNKAEYVNKLYEYDRNMLLEFQEIQRVIAEKQEELAAQKKELEEAQKELKAEKKALEEKLAQLEVEYEDYEERIADARSLANALRVEASEQERALSVLVAQKNQAAAREQSLLAEQAAAELAQYAAQETPAETQEEGTETAPAPAKTTQPAKTVSSGGSAAGRSVVNYASQFVGNPYVYGGSSLTGGTDCSGFTMAVYSNFGVSLPHNSEAQMNYGTAIASLDEAVAGDLLFYGGHVGIYCGDGTIVHASTAATGIKYSVATYRPIIGIRRLVN